MKDFTYFMKKNNMKTNTIRLSKYHKDDSICVITLYYPFFSSFKFTRDESIRPYLIFEDSQDHEMNYHKSKDPYDWHLHVKVSFSDLNSKLKLMFRLFKLSNDELKNINDILNNNIHHHLKKHIQFPGNRSIKELELKVKNKQRIDTYYDTLKYDITRPYYNFANFMVSTVKLNLKIKKEVYDILKKIRNNKELILIVKKYQRTTRKKGRIHNDNEIMLKTLIKHKVNIPELNEYITNNVLRAKIILGVIQSKIAQKQKGIVFKDYIERRLNIEYGWSLIQLMKGIKTHRNLLEGILKITYNGIQISDGLILTHQHILLSGDSNEMKAMAKSTRLSPLN